MTMKNICETLRGELGDLFACTDMGTSQRIRTPYLYPDGDNIDLFCEIRGEDETLMVTDLAETTRWLRMQSISLRRTSRQKNLIEDVCQTNNVEFHMGMLQAPCLPNESLAAVVTRVAQTALRVSDLWFTLRTRSAETVTDEVSSYLGERKISFERSSKQIGRSGSTWNIDFHAHGPKQGALVYVMSTGNRSRARGLTEHVVAAWCDLSHLRKANDGLEFVSLFNDQEDIWTDKHFKQVEELSTPLYWSRPDDLVDLLKAA